MSSKTEQWIEREHELYLRVAKRVPVVLVRGEGCRVWDVEGRSYLDLVGGWAVASLGHCPPTVVAALHEQAQQLMQVSNQFFSIPQLELAQLLVEHSPCDRVFIANSGTEANEGAIKLARKWGKRERGGAYAVISTLGGFHGRTLAMVAATGKPAYQAPMAPMPAGFVNVAWNDVEAIKRATTDDTVAVLLEPIQGEAGVYVPDEGYLRAVRQWCDEQHLLLILDEVQTGVGRCGALWGHQLFGVEPDIMTLAKGLGGGVPIGAFLAKESASAFEPGDHGSTFGGNPLACAAAVVVLREVLARDLPGRARGMGEYFRQRLEALQARWPAITEVRGRGLLLAVEFDREIAQDVLDALVGQGVLVNAPKPTALRFMPPLIITEAEIDEACAALDAALGAVVGQPAARA
ncbi:MAG TPA: aspartate aminotransferase family protein [Chloroflexota bacterium]|jgi:acetylornithine aminotransferase/acetylornithine/N-succinyldiaminopimelate aminotransferase